MISKLDCERHVYKCVCDLKQALSDLVNGVPRQPRPRPRRFASAHSLTKKGRITRIAVNAWSHHLKCIPVAGASLIMYAK